MTAIFKNQRNVYNLNFFVTIWRISHLVRLAALLLVQVPQLPHQLLVLVDQVDAGDGRDVVLGHL